MAECDVEFSTGNIPNRQVVPAGKFKSRQSHEHRRNRIDLSGQGVVACTDARPFLGADTISASRSEQCTFDLNRPCDATIERLSMSKSRKPTVGLDALSGNARDMVTEQS